MAVYLEQRGDAARRLSSHTLTAEVGTALWLPPNHLPKTKEEEALVERGEWDNYEGEAAEVVRNVTESIVEVSGGREPVSVTALPIAYTDEEGKEVRPLALFRVEGKNGETLGFVDHDGRQYETFEAWKAENRLPPGRVLYPEGGRLVPGDGGQPRLVEEPTHATVDTTWEYVTTWLDRIGIFAGFAIGGAALLGVGGILVPVAGAVLCVGYGGRALDNLIDTASHGQSIDPLSSAQARNDWLTLGASVVGAGSGVAMTSAAREIVVAGQVTSSLGKTAPLLNVTSQIAGTVQIVDATALLAAHWDELSVGDRMLMAAQMAFFGGATAHQAFRSGSLANVYSLSAAKRQLGLLTAAEATPPKKLVDQAPTVSERLDAQSFFGEADPPVLLPTPELVKPQVLSQLREWPERRDFSGQAARLNAARFVGRGNRTDGDYRLSFGEESYHAWERADALLQAIPKGKLADELSYELLQELNRICYVPADESALAKAGHLLRAVEGRSVTPGVLRDYQSRSLPFQLDGNQTANIRANGVGVSALHAGEVGEVALVYPAPETITLRLAQLIGETRTALRQPDVDHVKLGAEFVQRFVSLHPFQDGNGRTARLVMDRILAEGGIPPPILKDMGADVTLSREQYEAEVRAGVARTIQATGRSGALSPHAYMKSMLPDVQIPAPPKNRLEVGGQVFAQGDDGFIYNDAGRPHELGPSGELVPLSQLEHYAIVRRAAQSNKPRRTLENYTGLSRIRFKQAVMDPQRRPPVRAGSERAAIEADNTFTLRLKPSENERLVELYDFQKTSTPKLLLDPSWPSFKPGPSFTVSRYQLIDLEMWHVQRALTAAGDTAGARRLFQHREAFFQMAKAHLESQLDPKASKSPVGVKKAYELLNIEQSPLAFRSLSAAIAERGDDTIRVWRGDVSTSSAMGMAPDYSFSNADAFELAARRGEMGGTASIVGDLASVSGSSLGTGYLCYTTDLALLARQHGFADKYNSMSVKLDALPKVVQDAVKGALVQSQERGKGPSTVYTVDSLRSLLGLAFGRGPTPPGKLDVSGMTLEAFESAAKTYYPKEHVEKLVSAFKAARSNVPTSIVGRLKSAILDPPTYIDLPQKPGGLGWDPAEPFAAAAALSRDLFRFELKADGQLDVHTSRRAFLVEMDKSDALPGIDTLGHRTFEGEQEVTGLGKIVPWRIRAAYSQVALDGEAGEPTMPVRLAPNPPPPAPPAAPAAPTAQTSPTAKVSTWSALGDLQETSSTTATTAGGEVPTVVTWNSTSAPQVVETTATVVPEASSGAAAETVSPGGFAHK